MAPSKVWLSSLCCRPSVFVLNAISQNTENALQRKKASTSELLYGMICHTKRQHRSYMHMKGEHFSLPEQHQRLNLVKNT